MVPKVVFINKSIFKCILILNCYFWLGSIIFILKLIIPYSLFNIKTLFLLDKVAVVYNELGHFHEKTWIVLKLLEARRGRYLLEIFYEIAMQNFFSSAP